MARSRCFTGEGSLTWRMINEPYASELPGYNLGDARTCVVEQL